MRRMLEQWVLKVSGEFKMQKFPLALTKLMPTGHINNKHVTFSLIRNGAEQEEDIKHHNFPISII